MLSEDRALSARKVVLFLLGDRAHLDAAQAVRKVRARNGYGHASYRYEHADVTIV